MAPVRVPPPKPATRKSPRRQRLKFKITNEIHHQLLLGPTLARQAKKRKTSEIEGKGNQSLAGSPQTLKGNIKKALDAVSQVKASPKPPVGRKISPASPAKRSSLSQFREVAQKGDDSATNSPINKVCLAKTCPQSPERRKISPASPVTPDSVHSTDASPTRKTKSVLKFDRKRKSKDEGSKEPKKNIKRSRKNSRNPSSSSDRRPTHDSAVISETAASRIPAPDTTQPNNPPERESRVPCERALSDSRRSLYDSQSYNQMLMEATVQRRMNVIRRKKLAVEALMAATDIPSIFSSLWAFRQLHDGGRTAPIAMNLASDAQTTGHIMLTQWLTEKFTSPRCFGGLAFSDRESHLLVNIILDSFGASFGALDITARRLVSVGIPASAAVEIHPIVACMVREIRDKIHWIFREIMDATADAPLPVQA